MLILLLVLCILTSLVQDTVSTAKSNESQLLNSQFKKFFFLQASKSYDNIEISAEVAEGYESNYF